LLGIKLKSSMDTIILSKSGCVRKKKKIEGTGDFGRYATLSLMHRFRVARWNLRKDSGSFAQ
jgi:hypothetical protein